jgi:hypothetical protein
MTNQEAHVTVSIEQSKLFLLRDVPFDELSKKHTHTRHNNSI